MRGFLAEVGIVLPTGICNLRKQVPGILENGELNITSVFREYLHELYLELCDYDEKIEKTEEKILNHSKRYEEYQRLQTIPGIGPVIASSIIASVSDPSYFKNGRQFSAWIGLTPKHSSSGETTRSLGISKRGDRNLRRLLIHGARTVLNGSAGKKDPLSKWINELSKRAHPCKVIVALANKMARLIWAVLHSKQAYKAA